MNDSDRDALLARIDERMGWLVEEHKAHRQDYRDLLQTVNSHGRWLHVGKLMFVIGTAVLVARDYLVNLVTSGRH